MTTPEDKLAAIRNIKFPNNLKDLESWIGLAGSLSHLVPWFAQINEPIDYYDSTAQNGAKVALLKGRETNGRYPSQTNQPPPNWHHSTR